MSCLPLPAETAQHKPGLPAGCPRNHGGPDRSTSPSSDLLTFEGAATVPGSLGLHRTWRWLGCRPLLQRPAASWHRPGLSCQGGPAHRVVRGTLYAWWRVLR